MLTVEQQRKAVMYAVTYLTEEISDSEKIIRMCHDEDVRKVHQDILQELEKELAIFKEYK